MSSGAPDLSIVVPAYNEEMRLPKTLARIQEYLCTQGSRHAGAEVIVVDDGSTDGTGRVVLDLQRQFPGLRLVANDRNRGKGYSVRHGMLEAHGRIALFTDADLSAPIEEMEKLLRALEAADVAIGSRAIDRSLIEVRQSRIREAAGIIFNSFVRLFTGLPFLDTQCGFKAFRRERSKIAFEQQRSERFGFDPELLFLAKRHGLKCVEVPVRWAHDERTKVHVFHDSLDMFLELLRLRWNWLAGRYPRAPKGLASSATSRNTG
jgi:dolichyl-phosphate beta-glucosyltransferase